MGDIGGKLRAAAFSSPSPSKRFSGFPEAAAAAAWWWHFSRHAPRHPAASPAARTAAGKNRLSNPSAAGSSEKILPDQSGGFLSPSHLLLSW